MARRPVSRQQNSTVDPIVLENVVLPLAGMTMVVILGLPIVRAVVRRIEQKGGGASDPPLRIEVDELRAQVERVAELRDRVVELEERVEFTERVWARERSPGRLPPGE